MKIIIIVFTIMLGLFILLSAISTVILGALKEKQMKVRGKDTNAIIDRLYEIEIELDEKPKCPADLRLERSELEQILIDRGKHDENEQ